MDELVTDLRFALKDTVDRHSANSDTTIGTLDSPCATPDPVRKQPKKRRGRKRRSDNPPPWDCAKDTEESNDSIEEAVKDYVENITMCQSESDDEVLVTKRLSSLRFLPYNPLPERAESDSAVSENVTSLSKRRTKRKRKLKRISQQSNITGQTSMDFCTTGNVKTLRRRARRPRTGKYAKRDASAESESMAMDISGVQSTSTLGPFGESNSHFQGVLGATGYGHKERCVGACACLSPQSDSSYSDSDGFVTTDEGRLADDENDVESCWEPDVEIVPWWEKKDISQEDLEEDKFQQILNGVHHYTEVPDGQRDYWSKKDGGLDSRLRRVKEDGSYQDDQCSVLVDANRRIGKFLKDPVRTEFAVPIKSKRERDQLFQLAPLYSLHCTAKNSPRNVVVFMKTRNMRRPDKQALRNLLGRELKETSKNKGRHMAEVKRRRETPPWEGPVGEFAEPIPASNLGNQMLRDMGWAPGTGLGADRSGITDPIQAYARPRGLGLGHPYP